MNDDVRRIKDLADSTINQSQDDDTVRKAAELLKLVSEIENQRVQTRKVESELQDSRAYRKSKDIKERIALLAPVFTTFVLAGTLALQSYQFSRTERDKGLEAQRQRQAAAAQAAQQAEAAEAVSWADALKLLSGSEKISPATVLLKRFSSSSRYGEEAHRTALDLLSMRATDPEAFESLFRSVFEPAKWEDLPRIAEIDRQLYQKISPLMAKASDFKTHTSRLQRLSPPERKQYDYLHEELDYMSRSIALLLKAQRGSSQPLDFHSMALWDTDLKGVDLSGADISGGNFGFLNLKGANLSSITSVASDPNFWGSAWWEASAVSPELGSYLQLRFPPYPDVAYASGGQVTRSEYEKELRRLQLPSK
jgi:hypothetical protein